MNNPRINKQRISSVLIAILMIPLLGLTLYKLNPTHTSSEDTQCPQSWHEWVSWRDEILSKSLATQYSTKLNLIQMKLRMCRESLERYDRKSCMQNLDDFTAQKYRTHVKGQSLGLKMTDEEYYKHVRRENIGTLPEYFLSHEFLHALDTPTDSTYTNVLKLINNYNKTHSTNVIGFPYSSQHLPSVDDAETYGRFFLYIPGNSIEKFAQYGIGSEVEGKNPNSISVISVIKASDHKPAKAYFNDLWRIRKAGTYNITTRLKANGRMELCYSCHKSPLIPIVPEKSTFDYIRYGLSLAKANAIMSQYGNAEYFGIDPTNYGPGIGIEKNLEPDAIEECAGASDFTREELKQIQLALKCQNCHNGQHRGLLNFPSGLDHQISKSKSLVHLFMEDYGIMPPLMEKQGDRVQRAIARCLIADYYGDFQDLNKGRFNEWLRNDRCTND